MRLFAALLFTAPALAAGPLNPAWVAADAAWVIHLDVEAAMASSVGAFLADPPKDLKAKLAVVQDGIGLDPLKDIRSVTVYGSNSRPEQGMVIIAATPALDTALERLKTRGDYQTIEENGIVFHIWKEDGETHYATLRGVAVDQTRILFLADSKEQVAAGLRVVDGVAPHRAAAEPTPATGSMIFVHGRGIPDAVREEASTTFVKFVDSLLVDMGESAGKFYANVRVTADSEEHASAVKQGAQGLLALGRMAGAGDPDMAELCNSVKLSIDGRVVAAHLSCDTGEAMRQLRKKTDGKKPAAHRKDGDAGAVSTTKVEGGR